MESFLYMKRSELAKQIGWRRILIGEFIYYIKAFWLLTTQEGRTRYTKSELFKLILKRQCRLHWLRS